LVNRSHAAAPTLDYVFPIAWPQGATNAVTLGGKFEPWPVQAWADCPGVNFNAETNNGKFSVQVTKAAPPGPHLLRVFNGDGASSPRFFIITERPDELEKEPNDSFKQAQPIEQLPATMTGRLEKSGDVDSFAVKVEAGRWLVARADAYVLGSPVDATLQLLDERGLRVAFNHDSAQGIDPLLAFPVEKSGTYILRIAGFVHPPASDIRYAGSAATIYRLTVTDGPFAHHVFPAGVQRGRRTSLHLIGWNLGPTNQTEENEFDASELAAESDQAFMVAPGVENRLRMVVSDLPELVEIEPNDGLAEAQAVSPPCVVNGRLGSPGDEDRFRFPARKGERFELRVQSASLGFPLDATLEIEDSAGKQLARDDDNGGPDPRIFWNAPDKGSYVVAIRDLFHRGGEDCVYRLAIGPPVPDFKVTVAEHALRVEPGKTNEVKIEVSRFNGHTNTLHVVLEGLPEGVTARPNPVTTKSSEVKVALSATAEVQPTNQPIRILVQADDDSVPHMRPALFSLKPKDARGDVLINQTDQLWLTVAASSAPATKSETKK
jgi:hypothetical protein